MVPHFLVYGVSTVTTFLGLLLGSVLIQMPYQNYDRIQETLDTAIQDCASINSSPERIRLTHSIRFKSRIKCKNGVTLSIGEFSDSD